VSLHVAIFMRRQLAKSGAAAHGRILMHRIHAHNPLSVRKTLGLTDHPPNLEGRPVVLEAKIPGKAPR
jgi:hypothetical protein